MATSPLPLSHHRHAIHCRAVALPSCRPLPPLLLDCCRFHRHRRVNVHPPLLPSRLLCCACHRRPSPSRHPSPPLLVDCCIFHVHCSITLHCRHSIGPTIAINAVAVALPSRCPCPLPPSLVDCCLAVGSHCNRRADHRCHCSRSVAPFIAVAIVAIKSLSRLQSRAVAIASPSSGVVHANVGQKLVICYILRDFFGDRFRFCDAT